jgi:hypothetical protein
MSSTQRGYNLLQSESPAQRPARWKTNSGVLCTLVPVPEALRGTATIATRIKLPPKTSIYEPTDSPVPAGVSATARIWIWANQPAAPEGLKLILARHDDSAWEGGVWPIRALTLQPTEIEGTSTFDHAHTRVRFELRNDSTQEITLYIAAPSVTNRYSGTVTAPGVKNGP